MDTKKQIEEGKAVLGIEFGSTRIKAVLIDEEHHPIASHGKINWSTDFGLTALMPFGMDCRTAIRI